MGCKPSKKAKVAPAVAEPTRQEPDPRPPPPRSAFQDDGPSTPAGNDAVAPFDAPSAGDSGRLPEIHKPEPPQQQPQPVQPPPPQPQDSARPDHSSENLDLLEQELRMAIEASPRKLAEQQRQEQRHQGQQPSRPDLEHTGDTLLDELADDIRDILGEDSGSAKVTSSSPQPRAALAADPDQYDTVPNSSLGLMSSEPEPGPSAPAPVEEDERLKGRIEYHPPSHAPAPLPAVEPVGREQKHFGPPQSSLGHWALQWENHLESPQSMLSFAGRLGTGDRTISQGPANLTKNVLPGLDFGSGPVQSDLGRACHALHTAIELLLEKPINVAQEKLLQENALETGAGVREIQEVTSAVRDSIVAIHGTQNIGAGVQTALECLHILFTTAAKQCPQAELWTSDTLNGLINLLTPGIEGDVNTVLDQDEVSERLGAYAASLESVGVPSTLHGASQFSTQGGATRESSTFWMSPRSKSLLLYLFTLTRGQTRLVMVVSRATVLENTVAELEKNNHVRAGVSSNPRGPTLKLFPSYKEVDDRTGGVGGATVEGRIEAGEGHGPRKELFALLSEQFALKWGPAVEKARSGPDVAVSGEEGRSKVVLSRGDYAFKGVSAGHQLVLTLDDGEEITTRIVAVENQQRVRVDAIFDRDFTTDMYRVHPPAKPLFVFNRGTGTYWFNTQLQSNKELKRTLKFIGWCMGTAIANRVTLDLTLPVVLFQRLLNPKWIPSIADVREFDPDLANTFDMVDKMDAKDFKAMLKMEDMSTKLSKEQYFTATCKDMFFDSIHWQFEALREGFTSVVHPDLLRMLGVRAVDLQLSCCTQPDSPEDDFDFRTVFRLVMDQEFGRYPAFEQAFWTVVGRLDVARKRQLLKFVTGRDRLPLPKSEVLRIELPDTLLYEDEFRHALVRLPQSHTCTNSLELPNYWQAIKRIHGQPQIPSFGRDDDDDANNGGATGAAAELKTDEDRRLYDKLLTLLEEKLLLAISHNHGYGLDRIGPDGPGAAGADDDDDSDDDIGEMLYHKPKAKTNADRPQGAASVDIVSVADSIDEIPTL